jgi:hypothetical protein
VRGSRRGERGDLVIVEHLVGHATAAVTAAVVPVRPRLPGRARRTGGHLGQRAHHRELGRVDLRGERMLGRVLEWLGAHPPAQLDQLGRPRRRLAQLDQQALDGDQHAQPYLRVR